MPTLGTSAIHIGEEAAMELVMFVKDKEMPAAHDWMFVRNGQGDEAERYLFVRESRVTPGVLSEAWRAIRSHAEALEQPCVPSALERTAS